MKKKKKELKEKETVKRGLKRQLHNASGDNSNNSNNEWKDGKEEANELSHVLSAAGVVHVRARRGEATDSHSLAERVLHPKQTKFFS